MLEVTGIKKEVLKTNEMTRRAAISLVGLFEDIISGIGQWDLVVSECLRRYGKALPFYKTDTYVRGEINVQDVQLLLWDLCQSCWGKSVINPENPLLLGTAQAIFGLFDDEYEYAPENEQLKTFLDSNDVVDGYWKARCRLEWLLQSSFLNHRYMSELPDDLDEVKNSEAAKELGVSRAAYYLQIDRLFNFRSNLLSMRTPEILSAICGLDSDGKIGQMRLLPIFRYVYEGADKRHLTLRRIVDKELFQVEIDSFDNLDTKPLTEGVSHVSCSLVNYGSKWYQIGMMTLLPSGRALSEAEMQEQLQRLGGKNSAEIAEKVRNALGGRSIAVFPSFNELREFVTAVTGISVGIDGINPKSSFLLATDSKTGISIGGGLNYCVSLPENLEYDKSRAEKDAISFFANPDACTYETSCALQEVGALPDARLESIRGPEYGRRFLHENGQFFTDYFFHRYQGDDL